MSREEVYLASLLGMSMGDVVVGLTVQVRVVKLERRIHLVRKMVVLNFLWNVVLVYSHRGDADAPAESLDIPS